MDPDADGVTNELTRADITAAVMFQASLPVPTQVMPESREAREAVRTGQRLFGQVGCTSCHIPALPLDRKGWIFSEPNPYNPPGNLQLDEAPDLRIDLTSDKLPGPRLKPDSHGVVWVPAFTDLKLHDICGGPGDPNVEPLNMQAPNGSAAFFEGNARFLTRKLWGVANVPPFFHHGMFTTMREAVLAHSGEALTERKAFQALAPGAQDSIIEFLKSLQVLPQYEVGRRPAK
jgi:CxxC motif-containing protein (DUF1111 family)